MESSLAATDLKPAKKKRASGGGPAFLAGGGEMGERIRAHDWSGSPIGPPETWPQSLRTAVGIVINSNFPSCLVWGPELVTLYNDAFVPILGEKPEPLGRPFSEVWSEVWDEIGPIAQRALAGESTYIEDFPLVLERRGYPEQTYFTFCYSPVRDENGNVAGFLDTVVETTANVTGERRHGFRLALQDRLHGEADPGEGVAVVCEALGLHLDAGQVVYGEADSKAQTASVERGWNGGRMPAISGRHSIDGYGPGHAADLRAGKVVVADDVRLDPRTCPPDALAALESLGIRSFINVPLIRQGQLAAILSVHSAVPRAWSADEIDLAQEVAERVWAAAERARAETRLRESEARLRALTDHLPAGMVYQMYTGLDGSERRFLYVSQSHEQLTGVPAEAVIADPSIAYNLILPEHLAAMVEEEAEAIAELRPFDMQVQFRRADGELRWCRIISAPRPQPDGSLIWDGIQIDVTEQKEAEEALRESEMRFQGIVNSIDQMIWSTRPDGYHDFFNRRWYEYTGVPDGSTEGEAWNGMFHPEDQERAWGVWRHSLETGEPYHIEYRLRHRSGEYRWVLGRAQPVRDDAGKITRWFGTCTDIEDIVAAREVLSRSREELEALVAERTEELVKAQEALAQAQKMDAMGQLTGGVAHDFNNLLTPIVGSLDLLHRKGIGSERERRLIDGALQSAERARTLVQRLLAFARRQPLQPTAVDVAAIVEGMADLVASTSGPRVKVELDLSTDLPPACADSNQLEMAILNLAVNARDAMPDGGALRISAAEEAIGAGHRSKLSPGRYVRIGVADTGSGMDEATLARAVEPFFSTKGIGKGTGLGLSMVHGLASQLGGAFAISSKPGLGTNVDLWLPVSDFAVQVSGPETPEAPRSSARGSALLVDDEALVRASAADMLEDMGYAVTEADSAEEALRLIEGGLKPDLLVTDHLMPGMTGTELAYEVRSRWPEVPLLIVSGYAESEGISPDLPRLTKPFRQAELAESVARVTAA